MADTEPGMKELRAVIPAHCFQSHLFTTISYLVRDLVLTACLAYIGLSFITQIENTFTRIIAGNIYGFLQGLVFTGLWIIAHECGHGAMFKNKFANDTVGLILHSFLGVPYFSWKFSHARHHRYTNNMEKDTAFVPARETDFRALKAIAHFLDMAEDAPALNFIILTGHQIIGWPLYLMTSITSGLKSNPTPSPTKMFNSHFDPLAPMFTPSQRSLVLLSDLGLAATGISLYLLGCSCGWTTVAWLYGLPYLWVNHWIVMITYLHHTHPDAIHYENETWTFQKGALATVDRDFGFIGRHLFHGIIEFHVIHHLFSKIPFYHAEEATQHVRKLLGDQYLHSDSNIFSDLWKTFLGCTHVVQDRQDTGQLRWAKMHVSAKKPSL